MLTSNVIKKVALIHKATIYRLKVNHVQLGFGISTPYMVAVKAALCGVLYMLLFMKFGNCSKCLYYLNTQCTLTVTSFHFPVCLDVGQVSDRPLLVQLIIPQWYEQH